MTQTEVERILGSHPDESEITGVRSVVLDETENEPWKLLPSRKPKEPVITGPLPDRISIVIGNQIFVDKENLPAALRNCLIRLTAFQNPEFYKAQAMHLSTYGKPRIISCCEEFPKHLALPRGCLDELNSLLSELKIRAEIKDERVIGQPVSLSFQCVLRPEQ